MLSLVIASLKARKAAFAGAFLALFCAAALVTACGTLLETGLRGKIEPERYAGTPLIVSGDQFVRAVKHKKHKTKIKAKPISERAWIDAGLADRIRRLDGVQKVITEVTFPVSLGGGNAWGHGWESAALTPFTLREGHAPKGDGEVVVDAHTAEKAQLKVGGEVTVNGSKYQVVGVTAQKPEHQTALFFSTAQAQRLAGRPGRVTAIGVFPKVDVTKVLAGTTATTHTGDDRGKVEFLGGENARVKLISLGGALGGTSLLVAVLVVSGTLALSMQQRQRELALLRAVAATPRQLRSMIGRETLLVGLVAGTLGAGTGPLLAHWLRLRFIALHALPENLNLVSSPFPIFAAILATALTAWAAARLSVRRLSKIRPVEALGDAALKPARLGIGRTLAGLVLLAGSITLTIVLSGLTTEAAASPVVMLTAILWTMTVSLLGPVIARAALTVLSLPLLADRSMGSLAVANLRTGARRLSSVITPLCLMVALTSTILFTQTTLQKAAEDELHDGLKAPGITAIHSSVRIGLTKFSVQGVKPENLDLGVREGSIDGLNAQTMAVSARTGHKLGETVKVTLGDGTPVELKIIAVYTRGLAFGDLTLSRDLLAEHVDNPAAVATAPQNNAEVNYVAMGLIIAFAAIAVVNTLAMSTADRAKEFALLRLVGTTRRQILRMLRWETLVVTVLATVLGTAIALVTLTAFSSGMTGRAVPYLPPLTYLSIIMGAAALALVATVVPARVALRTSLATS